MGCAIKLFPKIALRQAVTTDTFSIRDEKNFKHRLLGGGSVTFSDNGSGKVRVTCDEAHSLFGGESIDLTGDYTDTGVTVTYVSPTIFDVTSVTFVSGQTSGSWQYANEFDVYDLIATDGAQFGEGDPETVDLVLGQKAKKSSTITIAIPNLEAPATTYSDWKTKYSNCESFDIGIFDEDSHVGAIAFGIPAQFAIQLNSGDLIRMILSGEFDTNDFAKSVEVCYFSVPMRFDQVRAFFDILNPKYLTLSGIANSVSELKDRSGNSNDATQSTDANRADLKAADQIGVLVFQASSSQNYSAGSGSSLDIGTKDFSIFGICVIGTGASNQPIISKINASDGFELVANYSSDTLTFRINNGTTSLTAVFDIGSEKSDYFYFVGRADRDGNMKISVNGGADVSTDISSFSSDTIGDSENLIIGGTGAGADYFDGSLALVGFLMKNLSDSEKSTLENHLALLTNQL